MILPSNGGPQPRSRHVVEYGASVSGNLWVGGLQRAANAQILLRRSFITSPPRFLQEGIPLRSALFFLKCLINGVPHTDISMCPITMIRCGAHRFVVSFRCVEWREKVIFNGQKCTWTRGESPFLTFLWNNLCESFENALKKSYLCMNFAKFLWDN